MEDGGPGVGAGPAGCGRGAAGESVARVGLHGGCRRADRRGGRLRPAQHGGGGGVPGRRRSSPRDRRRHPRGGPRGRMRMGCAARRRLEDRRGRRGGARVGGLLVPRGHEAVAPAVGRRHVRRAGGRRDGPPAHGLGVRGRSDGRPGRDRSACRVRPGAVDRRGCLRRVVALRRPGSGVDRPACAASRAPHGLGGCGGLRGPTVAPSALRPHVGGRDAAGAADRDHGDAARAGRGDARRGRGRASPVAASGRSPSPEDRVPAGRGRGVAGRVAGALGTGGLAGPGVGPRADRSMAGDRRRALAALAVSANGVARARGRRLGRRRPRRPLRRRAPLRWAVCHRARRRPGRRRARARRGRSDAGGRGTRLGVLAVRARSSPRDEPRVCRHHARARRSHRRAEGPHRHHERRVDRGAGGGRCGRSRGAGRGGGWHPRPRIGRSRAGDDRGGTVVERRLVAGERPMAARRCEGPGDQRCERDPARRAGGLARPLARRRRGARPDGRAEALQRPRRRPQGGAPR
jgi:hypothetical protein